MVQREGGGLRLRGRLGPIPQRSHKVRTRDLDFVSGATGSLLEGYRQGHDVI